MYIHVLVNQQCLLFLLASQLMAVDVYRLCCLKIVYRIFDVIQRLYFVFYIKGHHLHSNSKFLSDLMHKFKFQTPKITYLNIENKCSCSNSHLDLPIRTEILISQESLYFSHDACKQLGPRDVLRQPHFQVFHYIFGQCLSL